jgi:hypothetical protein
MTTKVSQIYDAIVAKIPTVLTSFMQLSNAYEIERNDGLTLNAGFAVAIGDARNAKLDLTSQLQQQRTFSVMLTRQVAATEHDLTTSGSIAKQLAEDAFELVKALHKDGSINGTPTGICTDLQFEGDSGVTLLRVSDEGFGAYFVISLVFTAIYTENLLLP